MVTVQLEHLGEAYALQTVLSEAGGLSIVQGLIKYVLIENKRVKRNVQWNSEDYVRKQRSEQIQQTTIKG